MPAVLCRGAIIAVAILLLGTARPAGSDGPDVPGSGWTSRDVEDPFAGTEYEGVHLATHHAMRVIDAETGRGVAGAKVYGVGEALHRLSLLVSADRDALIATTDADGWVRLLEEEYSPNHTLVIADGFAPSNEPAPGRDTVIPLVHGDDLAIDLRDPLDRPVPKALVGYRLYCGHTPDVRQATTDTSGHAVVPRIDRSHVKWLWPVAPGLASEDIAVGEGYPFSHRSIVARLAPGAVVEGRVLDAKGAPMAGAFVGATTWHRGPWARTDDAGSFRLVGIEPFEQLQVDATDDEYQKERTVHPSAPPSGVPLLVRLADPAAKAAAEATFPVDVRVVDSATGAPVDEPGESSAARVIAWRPADGRVEESAFYRLTLAAGSWIVRADGWASGRGVTDVPLAVSGTASLTIALRVFPRLAVTASGLGEGDKVVLATAASVRDVTASARAGSIPVPDGEEAVLRVERGERCRTVRVPLGRRDPKAPAVALAGPEPTVVSVRLARPDGTPSRGTLAFSSNPQILPSEIEGTIAEPAATVRTDEVGLIWLVAEPMDAALAIRVVLLDLGSGDTPAIDLGELRFRPRDECRVEVAGPAGVEKSDVRVSLRLAGDSSDIFWLSAETATPVFLPFAPPEGSILVGAAPGCASVYSPIHEPGPFAVAWPTGTLEVAVPGDEGTKVDHVQVLLDGERFSAPARHHVAWVGGIAAGEHRVLVSAPGRRAREYRATWKEGEAKWLEARLDALPPEPPAAMGPR